MNRSKQKGTAWETAIVAWLRDAGYVNVERRALGGANDRGDIAGIPGVVIEAKNCKAIDLAGWIAELVVEIENDNADNGVVIAKRRGHADVDKAYAIMPAGLWLQLLKDAEG